VQSACANGCADDEFCDGATGACKPKLCGAISCLAGQACVNATGRCTYNPCEQVHCGQDQLCVVRDDGGPDCAFPTVFGVSREVKTAGGGLFGCSCALGRAAPNLPGGGLVVALAVGWFALAARRRRS
jgi:hypothetical protein